MTSSPPRSFETADALGAWLDEYHASATELLVRIYKKGTKVRSVTWDDCVVESLRVGWIDGVRRSLDAASFLQRLTPRKSGSTWSTRNRTIALRLIDEGRMTPAGLACVEAARANGRWDQAYAGPATMTLPDDFLAALAERPRAQAFVATLNRANLYAIYHRLHTAKRPETRARRMRQILEQLEREERFH